MTIKLLQYYSTKLIRHTVGGKYCYGDRVFGAPGIPPCGILIIIIIILIIMYVHIIHVFINNYTYRL